MRRIARPLFTLASLLSFMLCLYLAGSWVHSFLSESDGWIVDRVDRAERTWTRYGLHSQRGGLWLWSSDHQFAPGDTVGFAMVEAWQRSGTISTSIADNRALPADEFPQSRWHGFAHWRAWHSIVQPGWSQPGAKFNTTAIRLPYWLPVALTAVLPTWWLRRRVRTARRRAACRCPTCGYDLRATPDRCPECGRGAEAAGAR